MSTPTRYGIIGCGMMGQEHIRNIALLPDTEVSVIFEPDAGMRQEAAKLVPGVRFAESVAELLTQDTPDCLVIASPNHCHAAQISEIAAIRPLPLLVEKPLLTDPDDIAPLQKVVPDYPAPVWVAMEYRYMPPISALLLVGSLKRARLWRSDPQHERTHPIGRGAGCRPRPRKRHQ